MRRQVSDAHESSRPTDLTRPQWWAGLPTTGHAAGPDVTASQKPQGSRFPFAILPSTISTFSCPEAALALTLLSALKHCLTASPPMLGASVLSQSQLMEDATSDEEKYRYARYAPRTTRSTTTTAAAAKPTGPRKAIPRETATAAKRASAAAPRKRSFPTTRAPLATPRDTARTNFMPHLGRRPPNLPMSPRFLSSPRTCRLPSSTSLEITSFNSFGPNLEIKSNAASGNCLITWTIRGIAAAGVPLRINSAASRTAACISPAATARSSSRINSSMVVLASFLPPRRPVHYAGVTLLQRAHRPQPVLRRSSAAELPHYGRPSSRTFLPCATDVAFCAERRHRRAVPAPAPLGWRQSTALGSRHFVAFDQQRRHRSCPSPHASASGR